MSDASGPILEVERLVKHFSVAGDTRRTGKLIRAVDDVSFCVDAGEILGLVGESGSGKSTLARTLSALIRPTSGRALYRGEDIFGHSPRQLRRLRRHIQMIFQDPLTSLDPRMTAARIISEPWRIFPELVPKADRRAEVVRLLAQVSLPEEFAGRYPHQLSGGQRQRVVIARSLALKPDVLICDEAVSALDASVQAQIVDLLREIQRDLHLACIFITHDLLLVARMADRIAVMHSGQIVEIGDAEQVINSPAHPYTQSLLSAVAVLDPDAADQRIVLTGEPPDPSSPPSGCRFRSRCWRAQDICADSDPPLALAPHGTGLVACHFPTSATTGPNTEQPTEPPSADPKTLTGPF